MRSLFAAYPRIKIRKTQTTPHNMEQSPPCTPRPEEEEEERRECPNAPKRRRRSPSPAFVPEDVPESSPPKRLKEEEEKKLFVYPLGGVATRRGRDPWSPDKRYFPAVQQRKYTLKDLTEAIGKTGIPAENIRCAWEASDGSATGAMPLNESAFEKAFSEKKKPILFVFFGPDSWTDDRSVKNALCLTEYSRPGQLTITITGDEEVVVVKIAPHLGPRMVERLLHARGIQLNRWARIHLWCDALGCPHMSCMTACNYEMNGTAVSPTDPLPPPPGEARCPYGPGMCDCGSV